MLFTGDDFALHAFIEFRVIFAVEIVAIPFRRQTGMTIRRDDKIAVNETSLLIYGVSRSTARMCQAQTCLVFMV
jgi:predicted anti-sigma-YlaC factor YlaD